MFFCLLFSRSLVKTWDCLCLNATNFIYNIVYHRQFSLIRKTLIPNIDILNQIPKFLFMMFIIHDCLICFIHLYIFRLFYNTMHSDIFHVLQVLYVTSSHNKGSGHTDIGYRSIYNNISGESPFFEDNWHVLYLIFNLSSVLLEEDEGIFSISS